MPRASLLVRRLVHEVVVGQRLLAARTRTWVAISEDHSMFGQFEAVVSLRVAHLCACAFPKHGVAVTKVIEDNCRRRGVRNLTIEASPPSVMHICSTSFP
jgi:hypothetical protein